MITLMITAWPKTGERLDCLRRTLESLRPISDCELVSSRILSCESQDVSAKRRQAVERFSWPVRWRDGRRPNLGEHLDELWPETETDMVFYAQDDTPRQRGFDLYAGASLIAENECDFVRYYSSRPRARPGERVVSRRGERFVEFSHDRELVFTLRPHLVRSDFWKRFGPFGFGNKKGSSEWGMNLKVKDSDYRVFSREKPVFGHIGVCSAMKPDRVWDPTVLKGV